MRGADTGQVRRPSKSLFTPKADTGARRRPPSRFHRHQRSLLAAGRVGGVAGESGAGAVLRRRERPARNRRVSRRIPDVQAALPPGKVMRWGADSLVANGKALVPLYVARCASDHHGRALIDAQADQEPIEGTNVDVHAEQRRRPPVPRGDRRSTSKRLHGDRPRRPRDGRPPVIQSAIGTRGQITMGGTDLQQAQDLALMLRAGALPVPLKVVEVRDDRREPRRGLHRRRACTPASSAVLLVVVIMIVYYRFAGAAGRARRWRSTCSSRWPLLAGFDAVLTLPGPRGSRALGRHRGRRERADLRAHPRGAGPRQERARRRSTKASSTP